MNGIPQFAISVNEEENEIADYFNPIMNEMFCAEKGKGAYLNNSRIRFQKNKIKDALIVTGEKEQVKLKIRYFLNILMFQITFQT